MNNITSSARVRELQQRLVEVRGDLQAAMAEATRLEAADHAFATLDGEVKLSQLFAGRRDLLVIHSMGKSCNSCTMWADGFNGLYPHIVNRAAFALASPDAPDVQAEFAASRGWRFRMVSDTGRGFATAMGFVSDKGRSIPGVSAFQMHNGRILRTSAAMFEPQDEYCAAWRLFDLLPEGAEGWHPQRSYAEA